MSLPKTEALQRREAEALGGTVVFQEKNTDMEKLEIIPVETFSDYIILAMIPQHVTNIVMPDTDKANTDFGIVVGKNPDLSDHAKLDYGCTVETVGRPLKSIDNDGTIVNGNLSLYLFRTSAIIRKVQ